MGQSLNAYGAWHPALHGHVGRPPLRPARIARVTTPACPHKSHGCGIRSYSVYVAQLDDGSHQSFTPAELAKKFNWTNGPAKARLMKLYP